MSFSSDEINYLVYRYLEEAGFTHSAYLFGSEANIARADIDAANVPSGSLINIVQKGMYYSEAELCAVPADGEGAGVERTMIESMTLIEAVANDPPMHKLRIRDKPSAAAASSSSSNANANANANLGSPRENSNGASKEQKERIRGTRAATDDAPPHKRDRVGQPSASGTPRAGISPSGDDNKWMNRAGAGGGQANHQGGGGGGGGAGLAGRSVHGKKQAAAAHAANNGMNGEMSRNGGDLEFDRSKVRFLKGHSSEVFICAWSPKDDLVASGSGDSTARIWNLSGSENAATTSKQLEERALVLKHSLTTAEDKDKPFNKDVTSLDWSSNGEFLATGCYDGHARVWTTDGRLRCNLGAHKGPIFALKWNQKGDLILSAGVDKSTIVWDPSKGVQVQQFMFHSSSALDVDWINDDTFASCSTDKTIHVSRLACDRPIRTYHGHKNEVNAVRYDPHSRRLASCSDDMTLKIWSLQEEQPLFDLQAHTKEIYTIRWSPQGHTLASASFDHTVRLWDVARGECMRTLTRHVDPVYSVGFSPCGKYLASGSFDRSVYIWDIASGKMLQSYTGSKSDGGIFEVGWNSRGDKVAVSASDGTVIVLDVRHLKNRVL